MHKALRTALFLIFAALAGVVLTARCALADDLNYSDDNGIQYSLSQNDDGTTYTMTISGNGAMQDYANDRARPYYSQKNNITKVVIEGDVTSIGESAFYNCNALESVEIPGSVTSIGKAAFLSCTGLKSVEIPEGVTSINESVFDNCTGLESVTIPEGVTSIGKNAFRSCGKLTLIEIPKNVTSIGEGAFFGCSGLQSVEIPEGVTSIGKSAFDSCTHLTSVTIPKSVTSIGKSAFNSCTGLQSVTIQEGVTSIGESAFDGCTGLTSVTIPSSVTVIGAFAFYNCKVLKSVTIPEGVSIGNRAFFGCEGLETVILPEELELGENTGVTANTTKVTYTVSDGEVTITRVTLGDGKEKVEIDNTVNGMPIVGVGEQIRDKVSIPGHKHIGGEATCTEQAECVICGNRYGEALGHDRVPVGEAIQATCTEEGLTAGEKCTRCGITITPQEKISLTAHSYENGKCTVCGAADPTYKPEEKPGDKPQEPSTEKPEEKPGETTHTHSAQGGWQYDSGSHWRACGCGEVLERENHDLEWVIDRKPTEEEEGLRHRECSVCGYAGAEVSIPALGTEKEAQPDGEEDDALPEEPAETEEPGSDAGEYTDNPGTGGASPVNALLLAAGALGALLWLRKRRG